MKTVYALIALCFTLQACNGQETPTNSINISEYSTLREYLAATSHLDDNEYVASTGAISLIKPIDGAEFEGTSRDSANTMPMLDDYAIDWSIDTDDHTATVISPASQPGEDNPVIYFDDEGFALTPPAQIDLDAIQANDWWG
jgi:hypothetical protein